MTAITGPDVGTSVHDMVVRRTSLYSSQSQQHLATSPPPSGLNKSRNALNIQVGGGTSHSTSTNTAADMESSDLQGSADGPRTLQYVHQQQQYKYVPSYPQHLTPGMKRFLPQSHLQKQNLLSVLHAPHQMSSTLSPRRVRSPICFREGRRASDGYVGTCSPFNNTIAFPQRLYDKSKATGHFELHEVREEHRALQNQFGSGNRQNLLPDTKSRDAK